MELYYFWTISLETQIIHYDFQKNLIPFQKIPLTSFKSGADDVTLRENYDLEIIIGPSY